MYLENFCMGDLFPPFINLFKHFYQFRLMSKFFYALGYNTMLVYLLLRLFQFGSLGALLIDSYVTLICISIMVGVFGCSSPSYLLARKGALGSPCMFPAPVLESAISPHLVSFIREWC